MELYNGTNGETITRYILALIFSISLSIHGRRKGSLSSSGSVAAVIVGFISFASSYRFGVILILFYYTSSKFTHYKEDFKSVLEESHLKGGQRNYIQVFANSILATVCAVVYSVEFNGDSHIQFNDQDDSIIKLVGYEFSSKTLRSLLLCVYVAHYACSTGDTWFVHKF